MAKMAKKAKRPTNSSTRRTTRPTNRVKPKRFDRMAILVNSVTLKQRGGLVIVDARTPPGTADPGEGGCQVRWEGNTATCTIGGCHGDKFCAPKYIGIGRIRIYWCSCEKIDTGDVPVEFEPTPGSGDGW